MGIDSTSADPDTVDPTAVCSAALGWARERDYAGWDPYDGLNSPLLRPLRGHWFTRLVAMHGVHKAPINLRRLLLVPKERNPKGVALFASAYLDRYAATGEERYLAEAETLLDWLRAHQSPGTDYACWGYNFDWQNANVFFLEAGEPCSVVTVFCALAFLEHHRLTGNPESLAVARDAGAFVQNELNVVPVESHNPYSYTPDDTYVVINANALAMSLLARVGSALDDGSMLERADELAAFVVDAQTDSGAWYYSMPATSSHLDHDNFHTGFVLEALHDYRTVRPDATRTERAYRHGLSFYRTELFEDDGAPKFESNKRFPRDVHGSAQAIRLLARDGDTRSLRLAERVVRWTLQHLYDGSGYFYRRQGRILRDTTPYMRWNQAWMCYSLATFIRSDATPPVVPVATTTPRETITAAPAPAGD